MVFKSFKNREHIKDDDVYLCECGHSDMIHDVFTSIGHLDNKDQKCISCECPQYIFQLKTTFDNSIEIHISKNNIDRLKRENWDKK